MFGKSLLNSAKHTARDLVRADRGNVAAIFAIALVPMLGIIGTAVDYSRAVAARAAMQAALDTVALMVSKDAQANPSMTAADATKAAQDYFDALYKEGGTSDVVITATYTPNTGKGSSVQIKASASVATDFMRYTGYTNMGISTNSETKWGNARMRIAMALDVTGSMASSDRQGNTKLDKMKDAAKKLVDTLKASAGSADDIYLSIIPFNVMVNVGTANKDVAWLDWDTSYGSCSKSQYTTKSACTGAGKTWTARNVSNWQGCVTDRAQNYDTTSTAPTTNTPDTLYLAKSYSSCPTSLLPMTSIFSSSNVTTIKNKIDSLTAVGNTNQAIGMQIAWMMLQGSTLFPVTAKDPNYQYNDVIILLSDGENTQDRWYSRASQIDARQKLLCDNINPESSDSATKKARTAVYTIQVDTDGAGESAVLRYCADPGKFYPTTDTTGMAQAFSAIGNSLVSLQISK